MTVTLNGSMIHLDGDCRVEEAETLLQLLQSEPDRSVDVSSCVHLHGAVVQVLLELAPQIQGAPDDPFLRDMLLPNLRPTRPAAEDEDR